MEAVGLIESMAIFGDVRPITMLADNAAAAILAKHGNIIPFNGGVVKLAPSSNYEAYGTLAKLCVPLMSPYQRTISLDTDMVFMRDPDVLWGMCAGRPFAAAGKTHNGDWHWGRIADVESSIGRRIHQINGGMLYFDRALLPKTQFMMCAVMAYRNWEALGIKPWFRGGVVDEILFAVAMAMTGVPPLPMDDVQAFSFDGSGCQACVLHYFHDLSMKSAASSWLRRINLGGRRHRAISGFVDEIVPPEPVKE